jgi:copper(I)-binding protein
MQIWRTASAALLATALMSGTLGGALAGEYRVGELRVTAPWARATAGPVKTGAVYLTLSNHGKRADELVAVASPSARRATLHTHLMAGGVMKMRPLERIEVGPGASSVLAPGGLHIMLMGLKAPLVEGGRFPLTLTFARAGTVEIQIEVQAVGAKGPDR